jgi:hypothetical protein
LATEFYAAKNFKTEAELIAQIEKDSGKGKTPLKEVVIIGHGDKGMSKTGDQAPAGEHFAVKNWYGQTDYAKWPDWKDAVKGELPRLGWFDINATVRFAGCNTATMAEYFGMHALRKSATAIGTQLTIAAERTKDGKVVMGFYQDDMKGYMAGSPYTDRKAFHADNGWVSENGHL